MRDSPGCLLHVESEDRTEQKTEQTEDRTVRIPTLAGMIEFYVAEATCGPNHARMAEHSYYSG